MKDYTRVIDNIVKDIVDNEIKSLEKAPSENVTKKRNISLKIFKERSEIPFNDSLDGVDHIITLSTINEKDNAIIDE